MGLIFHRPMSDAVDKDKQLNEKLAATGLRFTPQRQHIFGVLTENKDHPTAEEVYLRAKKGKPEISMATVYNTLDALVKTGLVKQVNHDRSATRFCSNLEPHCHFYCNDCGRAFDIDLKRKPRVPEAVMPEGFEANEIDISMKGPCPDSGCPSYADHQK